MIENSLFDKVKDKLENLIVITEDPIGIKRSKWEWCISEEPKVSIGTKKLQLQHKIVNPEEVKPVLNLFKQEHHNNLNHRELTLSEQSLLEQTKSQSTWFCLYY